MKFRDRHSAGRLLSDELEGYKGLDPLVLGLPRGGIPVAAEIARSLNGRLDVLVVRKLGAPENPEFGFGAIGPDDVVVLYPETVEALGLSPDQVAEIIARELSELHRRIETYGSRNRRRREKLVILVDDGLAAGVSAKAAIQCARKIYSPEELVFATPVASPQVAEEIAVLVDRFVALCLPPGLSAIGEWYDSFPQLTDDEVLAYLK